MTKSDEKKQQEIIFKFQMFEQQAQQLQQQLQAIEQAIVNMTSLNIGLGELVGKKDKEIMAPIGQGIFARAKLLSEELLVDIGDRNVVKKSIPDTKKLIEGQIKKLEDVRKELDDNMEKIGGEMQKIYFEAQEGAEQKNSCGCEDDEKCKCGCEEKECDCEEDKKEGCGCEGDEKYGCGEKGKKDKK